MVNLKNEIWEILQKNLGNDAGMCLHYLTLWSFIVGIEANEVFEFGSGFSTLTMLSALSVTNGNLTTIDIRPTHENKEFSTDFGKDTLRRHLDRWTFHQGNSIDKFHDIDHRLYDLVLHDGSHTGDEVVKDLRNIRPYIKNGGFILVHDTNHPELGPEMTEAYLDCIYSQDSFVTLPWGYGFTLIRVYNDDNPSIELTWRKQ